MTVNLQPFLFASKAMTGVPPFPGLRPAACEADPARPSARLAGVLCREFMPVFAVRSASVISGGAGSAQHVDSVCNRFKVCRVLAGAVPAQVIDFKAFRYGAVGENPRGAMSADRLSGSNAEDAVSILVEIRGPRPTFIGAADIHLPPKSFSNWATGLKAHAVSVDESPRLAFGVPVPGVTLGGNAGLLAAAAPTEAVAVGPFNNRGATIGVKHWNLRSGGPLGVTSTAKGNLYARNYSTFTLSGGL